MCYPSPCGPNSQCRTVNDQAVCSCLPNYYGNPPSCKPECSTNSDCASDKACRNQKCVKPCPGPCGQSAECRVINHNPICSCRSGFIGDPFTRCYPKPGNEVIQIPSTFKKNKKIYKYLSKLDETFISAIQPQLDETRDPCVPSPCGANAECRAIGGQASCSCRTGYIGSPPNCRPECVTNQDCISSLACINEKCVDPCPGSCGRNAQCTVLKHISICTCFEGYKGDPFTGCELAPIQGIFNGELYAIVVFKWKWLEWFYKSYFLTDKPVDLCNPSPCGPNAECNNGECTCLPEYHGDPYVACRPECTVSSDCQRHQICTRMKCVNPCPDTCGTNAICEVINHIPMCSCPAGYTGNSFVTCNIIPGIYFYRFINQS